ncbi:MAG: polysaccharide deacetylase family protein [Nostocoides sp.]
MNTVARQRRWLLAPLALPALNLLPALTSLAPARRRFLPALSGMSDSDAVALTYDDGPDPASTPAFLDLLERHDARATFFLLGAHVAQNAALVAEMADRGHELAVHGWDHQCLAVKGPGRIRDELARAADAVETASGRPAAFYRPPYGVLTAEGGYAARSAGLQTVLWSTWGRDWSRRATPDSVVRKVERVLAPGGTVLLHDTDRTSARGSWRTTLAASEVLLRGWQARGIRATALRDHGIGVGPRALSR